MEKLTIFDYSTGYIDIFDVDEDLEVTEDLIASLGYNMDEVYYMWGNNIKCNFKGVLK